MIETITSNHLNIKITETAIKHLAALLTKEPANTNIRISVVNPGTIYAKLTLAFCPPGNEQYTDLKLKFAALTIYIEEKSSCYLQDAKIDYQEQNGEDLIVKAPYLKQENTNEQLSLTEKIQLVIDNEINPILASHGGMIALEELIDDSIVLLRFGGGCLGCRVANITFQQTVEHILRQHFPKLTEIRNVTANF